MTYKEAFKIGSKVDGFIKCTYAMLHDPDKGRLFSLQRKATTEQYATRNADSVVDMFYDIPVVVADSYVEDEKWIPVKLTSAAREIIADYLERYYYQKRIYVLYKISLKEGRGWVLQRSYEPITAPADDPNGKYHYEVRVENEYSSKQEMLADMIDKDATFYVKACAMDWQPVDVENSTIIDPETGQEIKLSDALAAAEKKMQTAKALLVTAGLTAFI